MPRLIGSTKSSWRRASIPVEQLGEERQHSLGHVRATSLFEVAKKADDIATLDLLDRTIAECREDQPPQGPFSCVGASEFSWLDA
jgi:hypothetical protein